jgi:signal transduction histidine kinase
VLCAIVVLLMTWMVYLMRLRQILNRINARMRERLVERERIARDLHDTFFQGIQGLLLRFQTGARQLPENNPSRLIFEDALHLSDQVMLEGRELVLDLRTCTNDANDLVNAFSVTASELQKLRWAEFQVNSDGELRPLHFIVCEELAKLGREALTNAFRHSEAQQIRVELSYDIGEFRVCFKDNGTGIDPATLAQGYRDGHWGLPGMKERAKLIGAQLTIRSRPDFGTEIEVRVPGSLAYRSEARGFWSRLMVRISGEAEVSEL